MARNATAAEAPAMPSLHCKGPGRVFVENFHRGAPFHA